MLAVILHIVYFVILFLAFLQDWKFRAIHWGIFFLLAVVGVGINWGGDGMELLAILTKLLFVLAVMSCLFLYISLKEGRFINLFKAHFGIGDLLFFLATVPLFKTENYVLFFISGLLISALVHALISIKKEGVTIPLAGYLALYILLLKGIELSTSFNPFHHSIL
ncbi:MAG: hypothetical protein MI810_22920 [Flavobacteriales bacterium]|nr:hypothetical protein [Flavobacteriales bacterium]